LLRSRRKDWARLKIIKGAAIIVNSFPWIRRFHSKALLGLASALLVVLLSGCSIIEYLWLIPRASEEISIEPKQSNAEILAAVESASIQANFPMWKLPAVSYSSLEKGVIEFGPYRQSNVAGYAVRATIDRKHNLLKIVVKGAGPYYAELPVDDAAEKLRAYVSAKLARKPS
jgi:hypothetical protein